MTQVRWSTNKWEVTHSDVGSIVLLRDGEERKLLRSDVGMYYVVDVKGDYLELPPPPKETHEETDDYDF